MKAKTAISLTALLIIGLALTIFAVSSVLSVRDKKRAQMRAMALPVTVESAQPIIHAVERYKREEGVLPQALSVLVPKYIGQLPDAGPAAEMGWHYELEPDKESGGWALFIWVRDEYSPNIAGFGDRFVFHPSGKYRREDYGGVLIPFGEWGYYVE